MKNPRILDGGCGSGVVSLDIAAMMPCRITALDIDEAELQLFREKASRAGLDESIEIVHGSIFDVPLAEESFDVIFAEGLLNMMDFKAGFSRLADLTRPGGWLIIHDEVGGRDGKLRVFAEKECRLIDSFFLDEEVWGKEYFLCIEASLSGLPACDGDCVEIKEQLRKLEKEISDYKKNSVRYRSVYYILEKRQIS